MQPFPGELEYYDELGIPKGDVQSRRVMNLLRTDFQHVVLSTRYELSLELSSFTPATQARVLSLFKKALGPQAEKFGYAYSQGDRGWVVTWAESRKSTFKCATLEELQSAWTATMLSYINSIMRSV